MDQFDISIAGEINLDLILYGLDHSLPLDREILASDFVMTLGSSSAILAHNLAVLGTRVAFITKTGNDAMGRLAMEWLAESNVDLKRCNQGASQSKTGVTVLLAHTSTRHILTYPGVMFQMTIDDLDIEYLAAARHFHLSSLFLQKGLHAGLPRLFHDLKRRGLTISLDTNDDPQDQWNGILQEILPFVDVLLPNSDELRKISRRDTVEESLDALSKTVPLIAVKCGNRGAIVQHGDQRSVIGPISVQPVDTIGAGDSFNAGFLSAWLNGASPQQAAAAGNVTGALSTQKNGGTEAFRDRDLRSAFLQAHGITSFLRGYK